MDSYTHDNVCRDYDSGMTLVDIAKKYGKYRDTIKRVLKKNGVELRKTQDNYINIDIKSLHDDYQAGSSLIEISEDAGVTPRKMKKLFEENGLAIRTKSESCAVKYKNPSKYQKIGNNVKIQYDESQVISDYLSGMSYVALAKKHGGSNVTIAKIIKNAGVQRSHSDTIKKAVEHLSIPIDMTGYESGDKTIQQIALDHNVTTTRVHKEIKKLGLKSPIKDRSDFYKGIHQNNRFDSINIDEYKSDYENGMTLNEMMKKYRFGDVTITSDLIDLGVITRTRSESAKLGSLKTLATNFERYGKMTFQPNWSKVSKEETQFLDKLEEYGYKFERSARILKSGLELDGYDPVHKIAVEYCGLYWHSEKAGKKPKYHYDKMMECREMGIQLFTVFSDENHERMINLIGSKITPFKKVFARRTEARLVDPSSARAFIDKYHVQGAPKSILLAVGLFSEDDELLSLASFAKHHRKKHEDFVLNRFCSKSDIRVVGGLSKIMKHCPYETVITWSDSRWTYGQVYEAAGFIKDADLQPSYDWTDGKIRRSKQSRSKSATGQPKEMTEQEFNESLGLTRIWDCGKIRWKYTKIRKD